MRSCFFLVADKNMSEMIKGFFTRSGFHLSLGCSHFDFDPEQDIVVAHGQHDPGLFVKANQYLKGYVRTHQHAVVIIDSAWDGSPGGRAIEKKLQEHIEDAGWETQHGCAVVIDPELENWVWQNNSHVCDVLGYKRHFTQLRAELIGKGYWRDNELKPHKPKEAVEYVLFQSRKPRSSALYSQLASKMSVDGCSDNAFQKLHAALKAWFPN